MRGVKGTARCGTNGGYSRHMFRGEKACAPCKKARIAYNKRLKYIHHVAGSVAIDATGTRRRLQALQRLGHRSQDIAAHMGTPGLKFNRIYAAQFLQARTVEKVRQVYERLSGTPGVSDVTRRRAIAKGWLPPLAYNNIDDPNERPRQNWVLAA